MSYTNFDFQRAVHAYVTCALWSTSMYSPEGEDLGPLDNYFTIDDLDPAALEAAEEDVKGFLDVNRDLLNQAMTIKDRYSYRHIGFDFWLSRNAHGSGFFDHGPEPVWNALQLKAREYGEMSPYAVGDKVYGFGEVS